VCDQTPLKLAVDEASYSLQQVALLFDCAPVMTSEKTGVDVTLSPMTAVSLSPMSSVSHGDTVWTSAVNTVQVAGTFWLILVSFLAEKKYSIHLVRNRPSYTATALWSVVLFLCLGFIFGFISLPICVELCVEYFT